MFDALLNKKEIISNKIEISNTRHFLFLFQDDQIVYIGKSEKNVANLSGHFTAKTFNSFSLIRSVASTEEDFNARMADYIIEFVPEYNTMLPPNKKYMTKSVMLRTFGITAVQFNRVIKRYNITTIYADYYLVSNVIDRMNTE
jgi:excinuclease UvrABC nuclease subunit